MHTTATIVARSLVVIIIIIDFYPPNNALRNYVQSGRRQEGQANPHPAEMDA